MKNTFFVLQFIAVMLTVVVMVLQIRELQAAKRTAPREGGAVQ